MARKRTASAPSPAAPQPRKGIDVSSYQGAINWTKVAADGYTFAIIRCGSGYGGGYTDPSYAVNAKGARAAGLTVGTYYFAYAHQASPVKEAERVLALVQPKPGDLVPALDVEVADGLDAAHLIAWSLAWLAVIDSHIGTKAMLYTYPSFLTGTLAGGRAFADRPLWYASRNNIWPAVPPGFSGYNVLQTLDNGVVPGVPGPVDVDVSYGIDHVLIPAASPKPVPVPPPPAPTPPPPPAPDDPLAAIPMPARVTVIEAVDKARAQKGQYAWLAWNLGEGDWKDWGPSNKLVRPKVPLAITKAWWAFRARFLGQRGAH